MIIKKLLCLSILIVFVAGCLPTAQQLYPLPTPSSPHKVLEDGVGLVQRWETNGVALSELYGRAPLVVLGDYMVLVDLSKNILEPRLLGFDIHTGGLVWETSLPDDCSNFLGDQKSIYIATNHSLQSYAVSTGLLNWENKDLPAQKIYAMQIDNDNLFAYYIKRFKDTNTQVIYTLDAATGKLLDAQDVQFPGTGLSFQDGNSGYWLGGDTALSTDKTTSRVRWKTTVDTFFMHLRAIGQGTMLTTAHVDDVLYAIDMKDGHLKWQYTQQLISNPVIVGEKVFILISGEELTQLDLSTGKEMARTRFTPQTSGSEENRTNLIAVSGNLMAIYFADSLQVVVYQLAK
jgi:outer membrane protein assembly factor BamB